MWIICPSSTSHSLISFTACFVHIHSANMFTWQCNKQIFSDTEHKHPSLYTSQHVALDRQVYLYTTYEFNSHAVLQSLNRWDFRDCMKESKVSPGRRSPGGRWFHSWGPAAEKLLSQSLLCVHGTSSFRMSLELERSGRRPTSDRRQ